AGGRSWRAVLDRVRPGGCPLHALVLAGRAASCLTPAGFSLRSRVYEYGGGVFCLTAQGVAFVNEADQQIYIQDLCQQAPVALSRNLECRYGDLQFDRRGNAIVALEERHGEPGVEHRLVSLALDGGER